MNLEQHQRNARHGGGECNMERIFKENAWLAELCTLVPLLRHPAEQEN